MAISFDEARKIIASIGAEKSHAFAQDDEMVPLDQSLGRIPKEDLRSPISTPTFDSAAMDGYAVLLRQTRHATQSTPLQLRVMGHMFAGRPPLHIDDRIIDGFVPCVEMKIGAPFPIVRTSLLSFDAFVPREHARVLREGGEGKILQIIQQPLSTWHKRIAGSDFHEGDLILQKGEIIAPKHIKALASVGLQDIAVIRRVRVGVISVGSELTSTVLQYEQKLPHSHTIPDSNGPYLTAALREMGIEASYLGALPGHADVLTSQLREHLANDYHDLIIATEGAISGAFDQIPNCVQNLEGDIHFNQVALNPGYSTLFASLPSTDPNSMMPQYFYAGGYAAEQHSQFATPPKTPAHRRSGGTIEFFGLPGAPIASAACFRFLVTPFIRHLTGMPTEHEMLGKVAVTTDMAYARQVAGKPAAAEMVVEGSAHMDTFRHGILRSQEHGVTVEISKDRSVSKTSPFASSNCWVHVPRGHTGVGAGDIVALYPFCSPKS